MPNAKRPGIPPEASKIPPAGNDVSDGQVHDNMAPFTPAPVKNDDAGGERNTHPVSWYPEDGTGLC